MANMKQWILFATMFLMMTALAACGGGEEGSDPDVSKTYLDVSPKTISLLAAGDEQYITVNGNSAWEVEAPEWLTLSQYNGNGTATVRISAEANTGDRREATLVFTGSGGKTSKCVVSQAAQADNLTVSATELVFQETGGTENVTVSCETSWAIDNNIGDWCTVSPASGAAGSATVTLTIAPNNSGAARSGSLTVRGRNTSTTIGINQTGGNVATISNFAAVSASSSTIDCTFDVSSTVAVKKYGVCYSQTNQEPTADDGHAEVLEDKRTGTCTVTVADLEKTAKYYLRPYVVNAVGIAYGSTLECTVKSATPGNDDNIPPTAARKRKR